MTDELKIIQRIIRQTERALVEACELDADLAKAQQLWGGYEQLIAANAQAKRAFEDFLKAFRHKKKSMEEDGRDAQA